PAACAKLPCTMSIAGTPRWHGSKARVELDQRQKAAITAVLAVCDNIELAPGLTGIIGCPWNDTRGGGVTQPLILDINALIALAEIDRCMRLSIGVRVRAVAAEGRDDRADRDVGVALDLRAGRPRRSVTDVRRRLRQRDALSCADALAQHIRIARCNDRAHNPRTRAAIGTQARRARAGPAPRAAVDRDRAGDAACVRQAALRKAECG